MISIYGINTLINTYSYINVTKPVTKLKTSVKNEIIYYLCLSYIYEYINTIYVNTIYINTIYIYIYIVNINIDRHC